MKKSVFTENEKIALTRLKETMSERFKLLEFRVYGSKARGDSSPDSDIDVMVELEEYTPEIESAIDNLVFDINLAHDCFISVVIYSRKELEEGPLGESPLYKVIEKEGISI